MRPPCHLETSGNGHPVMQYIIPGEWMTNLHCCKSLKTWERGVAFVVLVLHVQSLQLWADAGTEGTYDVRRWADKFCLHCNIFIYIRHIWIKPVLCSRLVSLFHHTSPWTHRCFQSSPSAHRNGRVFRRSVQTACCYWILNHRKSSSNWNSQTNASHLWWSVCWCEYSKMLGKAVQR